MFPLLANPGWRHRNTWTPASLSGLAAWFTAGPSWCFTDAGGTVPCGDGDPVRVWKDRSGNARDLSQATSGNRPTLRNNAGAWEVRQDGVDDYFDWGGAGASNAWTLFFKGMAATVRDPAAIFIGPYPSFRTQINGIIPTITDGGTFNDQATVPITEAVLSLLMFQATGTQSVFRLNGAGNGSLSRSAAYTAPHNRGFSATGQLWVREMVLYSSALSAGNISLVEAYMGVP